MNMSDTDEDCEIKFVDPAPTTSKPSQVCFFFVNCKLYQELILAIESQQ